VAKSCASVIASATSADCIWSWASCWVSAVVRCAAPRAAAPASWPGAVSRASTTAQPQPAVAGGRCDIRKPGPGPAATGGHRQQPWNRRRQRRAITSADMLLLANRRRRFNGTFRASQNKKAHRQMPGRLAQRREDNAVQIQLALATSALAIAIMGMMLLPCSFERLRRLNRRICTFGGGDRP